MNRRDSLKFLLAASGSTLISLHSAPSHALVPGASQGEGSDRALEQSLHEIDDLHQSTPIAPAFTWLPLGEVKPAGWIKEQMSRDLDEGFAGCLDALCTEASSDIFVSRRIKTSSGRDWWNGETEGNWRAGFIALAYLADHKKAKAKADEYVQHVLSSHDEDGYLGAFAPNLRFVEAGDLWTQTCLLRGLLDYVELTGNKSVRDAVIRAADLTITKFDPGKIRLSDVVGGAGMSHDVMISDIMERLFNTTGDAKYLDFSVRLYEKASSSDRAADTSLFALLDPQSGFSAHGANTYETIRVPLWLWLATGRDDLGRATQNAFNKLSRYTEPSGSAVSQENISNLLPSPNLTQYEYCATKELQFTLESALQKTGLASFGDSIEKIWFNAAQGSRLADGSAITYLTSDNRFHCDGLSPTGELSPRNKFSPTHTDVAVCCNPNAANVAPLYVRGMWMRPSGGGLAAMLYGPCKISTTINNTRIDLDEQTEYPFDHTIVIKFSVERPLAFPLILRDPSWSRGTTVSCDGATVTQQGAYWTVSKTWHSGDRVRIRFNPTVNEIESIDGEIALQYGPLLFARAMPARRVIAKANPISRFEDSYFLPVSEEEDLYLPLASRWQAFGFTPSRLTGGNSLRPFDSPRIVLKGAMLSRKDGKEKLVTLVPLGNAPTLRRLTFPLGVAASAPASI